MYFDAYIISFRNQACLVGSISKWPKKKRAGYSSQFERGQLGYLLISASDAARRRSSDLQLVALNGQQRSSKWQDDVADLFTLWLAQRAPRRPAVLTQFLQEPQSEPDKTSRVGSRWQFMSFKYNLRNWIKLTIMNNIRKTTALKQTAGQKEGRTLPLCFTSFPPWLDWVTILDYKA